MLEEQYENKLASLEIKEKKMKNLLPVKTSKGFISQTVEVDDDLNGHDTKQYPKSSLPDKNKKAVNESDEDEDPMPYQNCVVSVGKLVAEREEKLMEYKLRIATLCTRFMECPEDRVNASFHGCYHFPDLI